MQRSCNLVDRRFMSDLRVPRYAHRRIRLGLPPALPMRHRSLVPMSTFLYLLSCVSINPGGGTSRRDILASIQSPKISRFKRIVQSVLIDPELISSEEISQNHLVNVFGGLQQCCSIAAFSVFFLPPPAYVSTQCLFQHISVLVNNCGPSTQE